MVRLANALAKREGYTTAPTDAVDIEEMIMVGMSMLGADTSVVDRLVNNIGSRLPGGSCIASPPLRSSDEPEHAHKNRS